MDDVAGARDELDRTRPAWEEVTDLDSCTVTPRREAVEDGAKRRPQTASAPEARLDLLRG